MKKLQIRRKKLIKQLKSSISILLAVILSFGLVPSAQVFAEEADGFVINDEITLTEEQLNAFQEVREFNNNVVGLSGFEGEFTLPTDDTQVPVIVFFESNPANTQVIEAAVDGLNLSLDMALQIVEDEHEAFRRGLSGIFGGDGLSSGEHHITIEYRFAMNGVAMTLPGNMVEEVAGLDVVRAIIPDFPLERPEPIEEPFGFADGYGFAFHEGMMPTGIQGLTEAFGMFQGRMRMNAHKLHEMGIDGTGVIVSIIDTGIDWMHPAFAGSFPTADVINAARVTRFGPGGTAHPAGSNIADDPRARPLWDGTNNPGGYNELFNINVHDRGGHDIMGHPAEGSPEYVFLGRDIQRLWPGGGGDSIRTNPLRPGGTLSNRDWPVQMPIGMPGPNPMEMSPLYFHDANYNDMRQASQYAPHFRGVVGAAIDGWQSHGTHVAGTVIARPYGDDPGRAAMGVAPGAWGIHYRIQDGTGHCSVLVSSVEWSFLDGANVVNISIGRWGGAPTNVRNIAISNIKLADPTIVFVTSAGNSGANYFATQNPSGGMAITVSMFAEPEAGFLLQIPGVGLSRSTFITRRDMARVREYGNTGNFIINHPGTAAFPGTITHTGGVYRIFAMPELGTPDAAVPVGQGTVAEFNILVEEHGAEALRGHFVLVRRGQAPATLAARAAGFGIGGVIAVNDPGTAAPQVTGTPTGSGIHDPIPMIQILRPEGAEWAQNIAASDAAFDTFTITGNHYVFDLGATGGLPSLAAASSRGPVEQSFSIVPDIGAHGNNVLSTHPRFTGGAGGLATWRTNPWQNAYGSSGGTSMSSPHVAGAVALMQHYSATRGGTTAFNINNMWPNYEIRTRIMNTAIDLPLGAVPAAQQGVNLLSPFEGTRQVDVWAAVQTNTVVFAEYNRIVVDPFVPFDSPDHEFGETWKGAFSFGGFNRAISNANPRNIGSGAGSYTMNAFIRNTSDTAITYTLASEFVVGRAGRPAVSPVPTSALNGATITFSNNQITVPANSEVPFTVTMNIPEASANAGQNGLGFHEGYITITGGSEVIVMPFAAVTHYRERAFTPLGLYRPVITTNRVGEGAHSITSNELIMFFEQGDAFYLDLFLICGEIVNAPGFNGDNWFEGTLMPDGSLNLRFEEYILGGTMDTVNHYRFARHFGRGRGVVEETMRGVIFDGYYLPYFWDTMEAGRTEAERDAERRRLEREGDFFIGIHVHRQVPHIMGAGAHDIRLWFYEESFLMPFSVDNTPPEFTALTIDGVAVDLGQPDIFVDIAPMVSDAQGEEELITITGNVYDSWLVQAAENNVTFDVLTDNALAQAGLPNNLNIQIIPRDNTGIIFGATTITAPQANGDFTATVPSTATEISFRLVDGYSLVPVINQVALGTNDNPFVPGNNNYWNQPAGVRELIWGAEDIAWSLGGFEHALRNDVIFGWGFPAMHAAVNAIEAERFNEFALAGLNVAELTVTINRGGAVNTTTLHSAIAEAEELNQRDYTPQTWIHVMRALATARAVLMNPDATQAQINDAADRIQDAINNLEELVPPTVIVKDALHAAIGEAEGLIQADYTPQTWMHLMRSLATARAALGNPGVTQAEIDAAAAGIFSAINGLLPRL